MRTKSSKQRKLTEIQGPESESRCPATSCGRCLVLVQAREGRFVLAAPPDLEMLFRGLDDLFNMVLWSARLTMGHQGDPVGRLGFRNGDRKEE